MSLRSKLNTDGYVVMEEFYLQEECDELLSAAKEFATSSPSLTEEEKHFFSTTEPDNKQAKDKYFIESNDKIRLFYENKAFDEEGNLIVHPENSLNKVGHALHYLHPMFRCYTYCDRIKKICLEVGLHEPAVVQSMVIYKNPRIGGEVIAHQDSTFLYTTPIPPLGFWIALEDATLENGCLWVAPGSHRSGVHRRFIRNPDPTSEQMLIFDKPAPFYRESSFVPLPVRKGTCILLHGNVVHKSAANNSDHARPAYTFHVIEKQNNSYATDNWLQEGKDAPFHDVYKTLQFI